MHNQTLLLLTENDDPSYNKRTWHNASLAHATLAFACDFSTTGERLTARASRKYFNVALRVDPPTAAERVIDFLEEHDADYLNIAGNGLHTLSLHGWTQEMANRWVYDTLAIVHARRPISRVRSGGQTGIDTAGLVAAVALGIPCEGHYPKGYKIRKANGTDKCYPPEVLRKRIETLAAELAASQTDPAKTPKP